MRQPLVIRPYRAEVDADAVWAIFEPIVRAGETYAFDRDVGREVGLARWTTAPARCFVAELDGVVAGTYSLRPNASGPGAHVANAGFMVAPEASGRGLGRAMGEDALEQAARLDYRAMQFNMVVSANHAAMALWRSLGFEIVGTLPAAFDHPRLGYVDAHVMYRSLV